MRFILMKAVLFILTFSLTITLSIRVNARICRVTERTFSGVCLYQQGRFYSQIAPLNSKIQEAYLKAIDNRLRAYGLKAPAGLHYYLGLALYAQKKWKVALDSFQNAEGDWKEDAELMKAACLFHLKRSDEFETVIGKLLPSRQTLCRLRIHYDQPLKAREIKIDPEGCNPIEELAWKCTKAKSLSPFSETAFETIPWGKEEAVDSLGNMRLYYYNPLNLYYLGHLLHRKSVELMKDTISLGMDRAQLNGTLAKMHERAFRNTFREIYCAALALSGLGDKSHSNQALELAQNLAREMGDRPFILGLLDLLQARCLMNIDKDKNKSEASNKLLEAESRNHPYFKIQSILFQAEFDMVKAVEALGSLKALQPKACPEPHSPTWGMRCDNPCRDWYEAMGLVTARLNYSKKSIMYFQNGFSLPDAHSPELKCHSMEYLLNLMKAEYQCGNEDLILETVLNGSALEQIVPEIKQTAFALRWLCDFRQSR